MENTDRHISGESGKRKEPEPKLLKLSCGTEEEIKSDGKPLTQVPSKKQMKKMLKKEKWEKCRKERRAKEKERKKQRKAEARLKNVPLDPSRKLLKTYTMAKSCCKVRIAIDLSFDDFMTSKDLSKCIKQVGRCYSLNRRAKNPMQLHITSFNGKSKEQMSKNAGYENWDIHFNNENYRDVFRKEDIVYLCSESENVLSSLNDDKIYVIGGFVDHNSHKGLTYRLAKEHDIDHCHLPLQEYLCMNSRKVLTIDHVFEILLGVSQGMTWKDAFLMVLPARKGAVEKNVGESSLPSQTSASDGSS